MGGIFSSYEDVKKGRRKRQGGEREVKKAEEKVDSGKKGEAGVVDELAGNHFRVRREKSLRFVRRWRKRARIRKPFRDQFEEVLKSHGVPFSVRRMHLDCRLVR